MKLLGIINLIDKLLFI